MMAAAKTESQEAKAESFFGIIILVWLWLRSSGVNGFYSPVFGVSTPLSGLHAARVGLHAARGGDSSGRGSGHAGAIGEPSGSSGVSALLAPVMAGFPPEPPRRRGAGSGAAPRPRACEARCSRQVPEAGAKPPETGAPPPGILNPADL